MLREAFSCRKIRIRINIITVTMADINLWDIIKEEIIHLVVQLDMVDRIWVDIMDNINSIMEDTFNNLSNLSFKIKIRANKCLNMEDTMEVDICNNKSISKLVIIIIILNP